MATVVLIRVGNAYSDGHRIIDMLFMVSPVRALSLPAPIRHRHTEPENCALVVREVIIAFYVQLLEHVPLLIATWATTKQLTDLGGDTPADLMQSGEADDRVVIAAERAAAHLAQ